MSAAPLIVAFADLDDTLFQTLRKLPGSDPARLLPATLDARGEPHSFCTPAQTALLGLLEGGRVTVIPVTGRDPAAMRRVTLPFTSWRVLDHGLTVLDPAGKSEPEWARRVRALLEPLQTELERLTALARTRADALGCRVTRHGAQGLPFMSVAKHPDADAGALLSMKRLWEEALGEEALGGEALEDGKPGGGEHGFQVIANANNVSLLPRSLGKAQAVRFLRERHLGGAALTLGLGDSVSDLAFMRECDFALSPAHGQLLRAVTAVRLEQR